ncbi:MAG: hypothetical protein RLZZ546_734 [Bacteroidota bacterium]
MNIFHQELKKKFGKIYIPNIFNLHIVIKLSYLQELYENNIPHVVIKVKYDENIGIVGYDILEYSEITNPKDKISTLFVLLHNKKPEIITLDKSQIIFLSVKKYLRKLKINKLLNESK